LKNHTNLNYCQGWRRK